MANYQIIILKWFYYLIFSDWNVLDNVLGHLESGKWLSFYVTAMKWTLFDLVNRISPTCNIFPVGFRVNMSTLIEHNGRRRCKPAGQIPLHNHPFPQQHAHPRKMPCSRRHIPAGEGSVKSAVCLLFHSLDLSP